MLSNKTVAITGATGGIGKELCFYLANFGAELILLDRNQQKSATLEEELKAVFPDLKICRIKLNLESFSSVKEATEKLLDKSIDILIHNAGAYSIPRKITDAGLNNVFQINFAAPYYITKKLLPSLRKKGNTRVIAVGSIAHRYSKSSPLDFDFRNKTRASLVYGNAKRYLMLSFFELFKNEDDVSLAVCHPGITFTNITAHYPKFIFALIKHPMKLIFMKPQKAALNILEGCFTQTKDYTWIGPRIFDVWGKPKKKRLHSFTQSEAESVFKTAEKIYNTLE